MAKFYLIDHSLKGLGGHHFEYAMHVLSAARQAGFDVVLGANRRFTQQDNIASVPFGSTYRYSTYTRHSYLGNLWKWVGQPPAKGAASAPPSHPLRKMASDWWRTLGRWRRHIRGRVRSRSLTRGSRKLFRRFPLAQGDHVFFATLNDLDLVGLFSFLKSEPRTQQAHWHMQFHFNLEPDWEANDANLQEFLGELRGAFDRCRRELPQHRLSFYTTTDTLARQYNRLGSVPFRGLPYPVNPGFQLAKKPHDNGAPLRITCVGGVREEKGIDDLIQAIEPLWDEFFLSGRAQLVLQTESMADLPAPLQKLCRDAQRQNDKRSVPNGEAIKPVVLVPHPLDSEGYRRLIVESDIGLLLYDRRHYLARCSGVLVEMLSAGVPVIVPAGCWLADQIAPEISRHAMALRERFSSRLQGSANLDASVMSAAQMLDAPTGATHALASINWQALTESQTYLRMALRQWNWEGNEVGCETAILSAAGDERTCVWLPLAAGTRRIQFECRNAYVRTPVAVHNATLEFFSIPSDQAPPLGSVGLIASGPAQTPRLLRDLVEHYPHYEQTAADHARRWIAWHNPDRVVQELVAAQNDTTKDRTTWLTGPKWRSNNESIVRPDAALS